MCAKQTLYYRTVFLVLKESIMSLVLYLSWCMTFLLVLIRAMEEVKGQEEEERLRREAKN